MRKFKAAALLVLFSSIVSCSGDEILAPPAGLAHASATRTCGPADGPAVAIYLANSPIGELDPASPYVRVNIWHALGELPKRSWSIGTSANDNGAAFYTATNSAETATAGTVTIISVAADSTVDGNVELTFPSGRRVRGGFHAPWIPTSMLCG